MTEPPVIHAKALTKVYKLYDTPQQKFLDMVGLLRTKKTIAEHYALDRVDLSITRGERVGIIGRNGAGKSTLLKLISGVIEPTSGSLDVAGSARALLEIGTGFHPEFTGRDNVRAYLAQIGISGQESQRLLGEVVEFAELEEYIDQPLKTYSTGMAVRLMFATSTSVAPELLILDEVLGVGDAYFTRKSFDRIEEMCSRDGATLLLVSHDIYTSAKLCDRMIWLDHGKIVFDGAPSDAVKAYEESIREQEEHRLRKKTTLALAQVGAATEESETLWLEVASRRGVPQEAVVHLSRLGLELPDGRSLELPLHADSTPPTEGISAELVLDQGCWGEPDEHDGRPSRPFLNYGSPYHKVAGTLRGPGLRDLPSGTSLVVDYASDEPTDLVARCFSANRELLAIRLPAATPQWRDERVDLLADTPGEALLLEAGGVYGTGRVAVVAARLRDLLAREQTAVRHLDPAVLEFDLLVRDPEMDELSDITVAIMRDGVETAARFFTRALRLSGADPRVTLELGIPSVRLGSGRYTVTLLMSRPGYMDGPGDVFYTVSPDVHVAVRDVLEFSVEAEGVVPKGTPWVGEGSWSLRGLEAELGARPAAGDGSVERVIVDYPASLKEEFPEEFDVAWQAVRDVIDVMQHEDVRAIGANSPEMLDANWPNYLECSAARMVRVARALKLSGMAGGRFLDYGSYFGNVTLMARRLGFDVDGVDSYNQYAGCFTPAQALVLREGGRFLETDDVGRDLSGVSDNTYDVVSFLSVIEHIPHTPRFVLAALFRVLKPGGVLVFDTPNHAYIYHRWKLARGESVHASITAQFNSPIPFEGHHREYTISEIEYMLSQTGFVELSLGSFDYSRYGISELAGITLEAARVTEKDWTARELIFAFARKPEREA